MTNLYDSHIVDILPDIFKGVPEVEALSCAVSRGLKKLIDYCSQISVYSMIDTATDDVLNMLALDLNAPYYDEDADISLKRELIKNTLLWYTKAGTPAAVNELIEAVFGEGRIMEWFEYDGDPYTFQVTIPSWEGDIDIIYFTQMISKMKNTRSHLQSIDVARTIHGDIYVGFGVVAVYKNPLIQESPNIFFLFDHNDEILFLVDEDGASLVDDDDVYLTFYKGDIPLLDSDNIPLLSSSPWIETD